MDSIDSGYSMKNIPLPSEESYKYKLIAKTEQLLKGMRWKAFFFEITVSHNNSNDNTASDNQNKYNLKSTRCPPQIEGLKNFENDLIKTIENIKFKNTSDNFLDKLKEDTNKIKSSEKIFFSADKTQNFYEVSKADYNQILINNITKTYKKSEQSLPKKIKKLKNCKKV